MFETTAAIIDTPLSLHFIQIVNASFDFFLIYIEELYPAFKSLFLRKETSVFLLQAVEMGGRRFCWLDRLLSGSLALSC